MLSKDEIARDLATLREIVVRHRAPEAPLAVGTAIINGIDTPVFTKVPANLFGLYRLALAAPGLPFLIYQAERYTYGETYRLAAHLAAALIGGYGIRKGDRIAICSRNSPQWCIAYMAITMTGAIAVPMNSWWRGNEMHYGLADSGSRVLFADEERIARLRQYSQGLPVEIIALEPTAHADCQGLQSLLDEGARLPPLQIEDCDVLPEDDASIMYTSGSSGHPKGVLSSHRAIISALYSWRFVKEITEILRPELRDDNPEYQPGILGNVPLFHVTGSHSQFLSSFLTHRKFVLMRKWDPEQALALIEKERLSILHGVPTMTWEVMNSPRFAHTDLSSLRAVQGGGASRPPEHLAMMERKFPARAVPGLGYGLTETNGIGAIITGKFYVSRPDSTGRPVPPLTSIRIVDDEGNILGAEELGEICIKGATVMKGYWNKPEETAKALKDGWLHTGDLGFLDDQGFLVIRDRAKDIVIRGGENIGCAEVEYALAEHPHVCEVAVFGLPDERLGEIVAATVMVTPGATLTEKDLQAFLESRLARFKIPDRIWLQASQLPRIASGKIAKKQIREARVRELTDQD